MKRLLLILACAGFAACNSLIPYKTQTLEQIQAISKAPETFRGQVVAFSGEVKGFTEDTQLLRLIVKIEAPFYYHASDKQAPVYELLLISFDKKGQPEMMGINKGHNVKILARVADVETRKNFIGDHIAVLRLVALAITDRSTGLDFFRTETPAWQLYHSWKDGRLFFKEQPADIEKRFVPADSQTPPPTGFWTDTENGKAEEAPIVYDEEETFILDDSSHKKLPATGTESQANLKANQDSPSKINMCPIREEADSSSIACTLYLSNTSLRT